MFLQKHLYLVISIAKSRNLRIIGGKKVPISISSKLLDPYNSFEFLGFPNHTFSDPIPNFSNFLLDSESVELLNDFKINTIDSILAS